MRFLFVVQGEGRGHLTQAITLEETLLRNGHEVVEILVGESRSRRLPGFFNRSVQAPVKRFVSPNFTPTVENKRANLKKSLLYNTLRLPEYLRSMRYIYHRIEETGAEAVINFYELLTGLTYAIFRPSVPYVCVGHQYLFLHREFEFPHKDRLQLWLLRFFTRLTALRAEEKLALSFHEMEPDTERDITVIPPLLRREVRAIRPEQGNYVHGYMVNAGFADSVRSFHKARPDVPLRFFWDNPDCGEVTQVDKTLSFHQIDDTEFLKGIAKCRAYATTGGFESICEAMYLGKPVLMVPAHIEQDCNAYDAVKAGAGVATDSFNLEPLLRFAQTYRPVKGFSAWADGCEGRILAALNRLAAGQSASTEITASLTNYLPI